MIELYLDTADVEAIAKAVDTGLVAGVTTNPSHVASTGRKFKEVVKEICGLVKGPVSAEVMADTAEGMVSEAEELAAIAPNLNVKITG